MAHALDRHLALIGFMGAGKTTLGMEVAQRLERRFVDLDRELEQTAQASVPELFETLGEEGFRAVEAEQTLAALRHSMPAVLALGGGAVETPAVRRALGEHALTVLIDVDAETAWERAGGSDRPLARDEGSFRALHAKRQPLYRESADAVADDADEIVLAAGGIHVEEGSLARLGDFLPPGDHELLADATVLGLHRPPLEAPVHALRGGEDAKSLGAVERIWRELRLDRDGTIVAFGGGCTTDSAGFAAATYLRGLRWVAVPSTLVGQVDAAIGGKTAVNLREGKNLIGAFYPPVAVLADPSLLGTLQRAVKPFHLALGLGMTIPAPVQLNALPHQPHRQPGRPRRCLGVPPRRAMIHQHRFRHSTFLKGGLQLLAHRFRLRRPGPAQRNQIATVIVQHRQWTHRRFPSPALAAFEIHLP